MKIKVNPIPRRPGRSIAAGCCTVAIVAFWATGRSAPGMSFPMFDAGRWVSEVHVGTEAAQPVPVEGAGESPVVARAPRPRPAARGLLHDYLTTIDPTYVTFGTEFIPPIPPGFFNPGSDPFLGPVLLRGAPIDPAELGATDTIIRRPADPVSPSDPPGTTGTVPIEIVSLQLVSIQPITVTYGGTQPPELWEVRVTLSDFVPPPPGLLTATKTHANGGTFDSMLPVIPRFEFFRPLPPATRVLDAGQVGLPPLQLESFFDVFVQISLPNLLIVKDPGSNFVPGVEETIPGDPNSQQIRPFDEDSVDGADSAKHTVRPSQEQTCVYRVACQNSAFKGACDNHCQVQCNDLCYAHFCPSHGTCATGYPTTCGGPACCMFLEWTFECVSPPPPGMPPCPTEQPCSCQPMPGACCNTAGFCTLVPEECACNERFIPGQTSCGAYGACCFGDNSCLEMDEACCLNRGGVFAGGFCDPPQRCCLPDGSCTDLSPPCCHLLGGVSMPGDCQPSQECCLPDGSCIMTDPECCQLQGGTPGPGVCEAPEKCCMPNGECRMLDRDCCVLIGGTPGNGACDPQGCCLNDVCRQLDPDCCQMIGGTPQGDGTACGSIEACCAFGVCVEVDALCCDDIGGAPQGAGTFCFVDEACCLPAGVCMDSDPVCCDDLGGVSQGFFTACTGPSVCCMPNGACQMVEPECCDEQGGVSYAGFCRPAEACCLPGGVCQMMDPTCCLGQSGTPQGPGSACTLPASCCLPGGICINVDPLCCDDLGGVSGIGVCTAPEACCLPNGSCTSVDPACCLQQGGSPQGAGSACTQPQACCLPNGNCVMLDPLCCNDIGGTVTPGACGGQQACCFANGSCVDQDSACCLDDGGVPQGPGSSCPSPNCGGGNNCSPNAGGTACLPVICPMFGRVCVPTQVICSPLFGCRITACQCRDPNLCHVDLRATVPPQPVCVGGCPIPGQSCVERRVTNPDGSITYECLCDTRQACCLNNGTQCTDLDPADCIAIGGMPQGPGSFCTAPAACCMPDGTCRFVDPECCDDIGGSPRGPGSFCKPYGDIYPKPGDGVVEVSEVLKVLSAYTDINSCVNFPNAELVYDAGCPRACVTSADCTGSLPSVCNALGECCDGVDVSEVLAILQAYAGNPPCPDGACR